MVLMVEQEGMLLGQRWRSRNVMFFFAFLLFFILFFSFSLFFFYKFILSIYFWLRRVFVAVRGLFSGCGEPGLLFVAVRGLLIAVASLVAEHGL